MKPQSDPSCAVILPIYNESNHLLEVMESVFSELPSDTEVIAVDDASTDNSLEILRNLSKQEPRLRVLSLPENQGPSAARNAGARATTAELLFFIDGDGVLCKGAFAQLLTALRLNPECLGCNGIIALERGDNLTSTFVTASLHHQLQRHGQRVETSFTALCLLKRQAWQEMGGWDEMKKSRYADDVSTRWSFPENSIVQVQSSKVKHRKIVAPFGLFKHRINIGHHFYLSLITAPSGHRAKRAVIDRRYPVNTVLAALTPLIFLPPIGLGLGCLFYHNNKSFLHSFAAEYGKIKAAQTIPLLWLEGAGYALGMARGALTTLGARDGLADQT